MCFQQYLVEAYTAVLPNFQLLTSSMCTAYKGGTCHYKQEEDRIKYCFMDTKERKLSGLPQKSTGILPSHGIYVNTNTQLPFILCYDSTKLSEKCLFFRNRIKARGKQNIDFKCRVLPSIKYGAVFYVVQSKLRGDTEYLHYAEIRIGTTLQATNTHLALIQQNRIPE